MNIFNFINKREPELKGLEEFVTNVYWGSHLPASQAKKNIEEGLVTIKRKKISGLYFRNSASQGLLITENGYTLTCAHCVDGSGWKTQIIGSDGIYALEKVCSVDQEHDLALVKARITKADKAKIYSLNLDTKNTSFKNSFAVWIKRKENSVEYSGCNILNSDVVVRNDSNLTQYNQLEFSGKANHGDSGSSIVTHEAALTGIINGKGVDSDFITATPISFALDLITRYVHEQKRNYNNR